METLGRKAIGPVKWQPVAKKINLFSLLHGFSVMLFLFYRKIAFYTINFLNGGINMKKIIVLSALLMFFLLNENTILAKSSKSKSKSSREKTKKTSKRNNTNSPGAQKSQDAKKNWGQLKKDIQENPENYPQFSGMSKEQIRENIIFEKKVRRIARKNEGIISAYYDSIENIETTENIDGIENTEDPIEKFIDDVLSGNIDLEANPMGLEEKFLAKLKKEKAKYDETIDKLTVEETSTEETEEEVIVDETDATPETEPATTTE